MDLTLTEKQKIAVLAMVSLASVYRYADPEKRLRMHGSVRTRIERAIRRVTRTR